MAKEYTKTKGEDKSLEYRDWAKVADVSAPRTKFSNVPVHITYGFLFLFIAATRYLIYFGPASALHSFNAAQAIGATLGYLFVWSLGYWFCITSPRKTLVTWIGGAAVLLSTLIGSYVGFVLLLAIYLMRRNQMAIR